MFFASASQNLDMRHMSHSFDEDLSKHCCIKADRYCFQRREQNKTCSSVSGIHCRKRIKIVGDSSSFLSATLLEKRLIEYG